MPPPQWQLARPRLGLPSGSLCRRNGRGDSTLCAENGITPSIAFSRKHNLEYSLGHSGEKVASEIYFERGPPIEKLILVTMVKGRSDFEGSSTGSRRGLRCSNSSATYPALVPSEKVTIRPSSQSLSTFSMVVLSVMTESVPHYQTGRCPILLILGKDGYTSTIADLPSGISQSSNGQKWIGRLHQFRK
jgi:hypothetical protein